MVEWKPSPPLTVQQKVKGNVRLTLEYLLSGIQVTLVHVHEDSPKYKGYI